jgi:alpha-D-ribose 1-methylphosphonate 5-triphosphate synthase subunit PhnG
MAVLAKAERAEIEQAWAKVAAQLPWTLLRVPETGLAMVQARAGGSGARFHFGEMTITRCAVRLEGRDVVGLSYVRGRDRRHAELAAIIDAHLQTPDHHDMIEGSVIAPLEHAQRERRGEAGRKAQATKVEFFAMVRGEDAT